MPATPSRRDARVSVRFTERERAYIEEAAALASEGDLSRFIATVAIRSARSVVEESGISLLAADHRRRFYDLLLAPPPPSDALRELAANPVPDGFELER